MTVAGMLAYLVCPVSRGRLEWRPDEQRLVSPLAGVAYPVRDGVPVLLVEAAIPLSPPSA